MFPGRDRHRQLQNVLLLTGILMASLSVSWAQIVVTPDPYLDLSTCRSYWESCDLDNNGAINPLAELGCFVNKLAVRKCNQGTYPTGNQNIVFVTTVCFEITYLECKVDAEIPVNADDPTLYNVCFKMDRTISQRCRDGTQPTPSPVTAKPTFSTNTNSPTTSPVSSSPFIDNDQQLTLQNCLEDLNAANMINADELTFGEYSNFLQNLGNRVCFVPDGTFNTARDVTFNQHRCLSRIPCAGSSTVDMTALNILDFCKRSYNFALSSSSCDGVSPTQPNPPSPTVSPSTVAPSRAPSAEPSSLPSLEPSVSNAPSVELETRGSGAVARRSTPIWAYIITALACARLLRQ